MMNQAVDTGVLAAAKEALFRFAAGQDLSDRELFESAFSERAVLDFQQPARRFGAAVPVFEGRKMIVDTVFAVLAPLVTTHTITNVRAIAWNGSSARLHALVEAQHVSRNDQTRQFLLKNHYWVDVLKEDRFWVIGRLQIENVWFTGWPDVMFPDSPSD